MRLLALLPLLSLCLCASSSFLTFSAEHNVSRAAFRQASSITPDDGYGAPIPPWEKGCRPGWYYGNPENAPSGLSSLVDGVRCIYLPAHFFLYPRGALVRPPRRTQPVAVLFRREH
ncbi:hypothetical protein GGX14DRAFT_353991 [Mycena pura]|uniref:Secreted protein n=1 Tax=Mycena pura TaxID=153505 RepID=A0AAD6VSF1_9AGAR|nr:hypothetical protein GGX14DRAFT_353991 [Mycena pura]